MDYLASGCAVVLAILFILLGFSLGEGSAANRCHDFGAFKHEGNLYDCTPRDAKAPR